MSEPKIILFDLEIIPDLPKALKYWTKLSSFPGKTLRASVSSICCIGWKVFGEKKINCINAWDFPEWKKDVNNDKRVLEAFLKEVRDADCIVTHNGKNFDLKHLQTRLLLHGLELLDKELKHGDTKAASSGRFYFIDNKLQTLGEELFNERKLDHEGWDLWVAVHGRDPKALKTMETYCKQDVNLLEKVFRKFRPLMKGLPNHNLFSPYKENVCPTCGSSRLIQDGKRRTRTKTYKRLRCNDCGSVSQTDLADELPR